MSIVWFIDGLSAIGAIVALSLLSWSRPRQLETDTRRSLIGLFLLVVLNYVLHAVHLLGGGHEFDRLSDLAQVMVPLGFFLVFYTYLKSQSNQELQASEERHRALFESSFDGILIADLSGENWDANPALCRMHGYSREEFLKSAPWTYIYPEDRGELRAFRESLKRGKNFFGLARGMRKDGSCYRAELTASLVNFAGQPHIMGVIRDISDRAEAEEARERLVAVLDATTDLVATSDPKGKSIYMNRAGRSLLGIGEEEDITETSTEDFHPRESFSRIMKEGMSTAIRDGLWRGETKLRSRDGRMTDVSQVIVAHRDSEGKVSYLSTIARDISEAKRAAESLKASERRLFRFMENLPVGIIIITPRGETYLLNRLGREMLGWDEKSQPAESIEDLPSAFGVYRVGTNQLYPANELPAIRALGGERVHVDDMEIRRGDRVIPLEVWASPVRNDENTVTHAIAAFMDISERKMAESDRRLLEEQLLQSQKMESIGMLAGGVAHDFNNLLVAIVGYSEMILAKADESLPFFAEVQEISRAGERATALTRQLLAFSRKQVLQPEVLSLNKVVRETERLLRRIIGEQIDLVSFLNPGTAWIEADPVQLEQVIINLAVNARDAMPQGGRLVFETRNVELGEAEALTKGFGRAGRFVSLSISDTGCGMDEAVRKKIFEPFFTTKGRDKGTGLGLSTVFGIVKQSGAEIEVQSTPGEGSRFIIYFPRVDLAPESPSTTNGAQHTPVPGRETVLLVEDESAPRVLSARVLRESGYTVLEAVSGEAAIEISRSHSGPVDLLLTDVVLPGLGGGELAEQLVSERPDLRVLYTSGYADNPIVQQAVRDGGAYLQKPFTPRELAGAVRQLLDEPE